MRSSLMNSPVFLGDFERLAGVTLNPERHTSDSAWSHSIGVARRAWLLALANGLGEEVGSRLHDLGLVHDIGKIEGTTAPAKSVELLPRYGITEPGFVDLVRYHDVNLPWHISAGRRDPPSDKAWRKMASRVDMLQLALFMVADRADCPNGFRANAPLVWFLEEVERRGLVAVSALVLDVEEVDPPEVCAGALAVREREGAGGAREVLVVDLGRGGFELPKGHVERGERPSAAALRELREESGVVASAPDGGALALLAHAFSRGPHTVVKYVQYARVVEPHEEAPPPACLQRRWLVRAEVEDVALVSGSLRPLLQLALATS